MKTLNELYKEIINDEGLKQEYSSLKTDEEFASFLKEHGCDASTKEAKSFLNGGELDDDDLDAVAGGKCTTYDDDGHPIVTWGNTCDYYKDSSGRNKQDSPGSCTCYNCAYQFHKTEVVLICKNPKRKNN